MNNMKRTIFLFLTLLTCVAFGQEDKRSQIQAMKTAYITEELDLSTDEAEKFWPVYNTPFIQGNGGMGIFSIDFLDEKHGVAIGGKWSDKKFNAGNKAYTKDGGKTWKLFANDAYPALQKQVSFVPNSSKTSIVAVGDDGISYTSDAKEWIKLSDKRLEHIYFVSKTVAYANENGTLYRLTFQ